VVRRHLSEHYRSKPERCPYLEGRRGPLFGSGSVLALRGEDDQGVAPILDPDVVEPNWIAVMADGDVAAGLRGQFSQDLDKVFTKLSTGINDAASLEACLTNGNLVDGTGIVFHGLGLDLPTLTQQRDAGLGYGEALRVAVRMQHHAVRRRACHFAADIGVRHETPMVIDRSPPVGAVPDQLAAGFAASLDFLEALLFRGQ
jgi:hypothetical protein